MYLSPLTLGFLFFFYVEPSLAITHDGEAEIQRVDEVGPTSTVAIDDQRKKQEQMEQMPRIDPRSLMLRPNGGNIPDLDARPVAWRWRSLKCWTLDDAVPCITDADCEWPCHWRWMPTFPIKCAGGEQKYCMMNLAGHLPHWLLERFDGSQCCWKPLDGNH